MPPGPAGAETGISWPRSCQVFPPSVLPCAVIGGNCALTCPAEITFFHRAPVTSNRYTGRHGSSAAGLDGGM